MQCTAFNYVDRLVVVAFECHYELNTVEYKFSACLKVSHFEFVISSFA